MFFKCNCDKYYFFFFFVYVLYNYEWQIEQFILKTIPKTPEKIIRAEYPDVFELYDLGVFNRAIKHDFIEINKEIKQNNPAQYKNTLRRMRPILEAILIKLNETDANLIPDSYFKKGVPNVSGIIYHLAGKPKFYRDSGQQEFHADVIFPMHIYYSVQTLYDISSVSAIHQYKNDIGIYTIKSSLFALLDFIAWFKSFYLKYYRK